jgi:hypothetical protein
VSAVEQASVAAGYRHVEKIVRTEPSIALGATLLKWYDLAPDDEPVPLAVRAVARRSLRDASRSGELGSLGELGFVILHRCGEDFYFLLVSTWRNENELWETVWAKDGDDHPLFRPWPAGTTHRPTYCVWELGAVAHEREAWTRYLVSARDEAARQAYLRDSLDGAAV